MAQGFKVKVARKTSANGNKYSSISFGIAGQLLIWDGGPDDEHWIGTFFPRDPQDDKPKPKPEPEAKANVADWQRPIDKPTPSGFFNDPLPASWKDGHTA